MESKHTTQFETTATAVVGRDDQTHDTKHPTQFETIATAVVGPDDHTNDTKHQTQFETTANAIVGSDDQTMLDKAYVRINEGTLASPQLRGLPTKAVSNYLSVRHDIIPVTCDDDKLAYLFNYFRDETVKVTKVLILARNPKTIGLLHRSLLNDLGLKCLGLSKNYAQRDREIALTEFIRGTTIVLISSFQLTLGLNLTDLETIFVHDMPQEFEEYLSGVQLVAKFEDTGIARVFFNVERDVAMARPLSNYLRAHGQIVPEWLQDICEKEDRHNVAQGTQDVPAASQSASIHNGTAARTQETATGDKTPATDAPSLPSVNLSTGTQQPVVSFSLFGLFTPQILSRTDQDTSNHIYETAR